MSNMKSATKEKLYFEKKHRQRQRQMPKVLCENGGNYIEKKQVSGLMSEILNVVTLLETCSRLEA